MVRINDGVTTMEDNSASVIMLLQKHKRNHQYQNLLVRWSRFQIDICDLSYSEMILVIIGIVYSRNLIICSCVSWKGLEICKFWGNHLKENHIIFTRSQTNRIIPFHIWHLQSEYRLIISKPIQLVSQFFFWQQTSSILIISMKYMPMVI